MRYNTIFGSTTIMVSHSDLCNIILDTFLESKQNGNMSLYNTELYRKVREKTGKNISHRDHNRALQDMVDKGRLQKTDKQGSKVFYSLTENAVRDYQHNLLGIDKDTERLRTLYQLLFFYEVGKYGQMSFTGEESFSHFLESLGLSLQDLKPSETVEMPEWCVRLTHFEPVKGIVIVKHELIQENVTTCYYFVILPGFTHQEILDYCNRTIMNSSKGEFYHSHYFLNMFSHLKFTERELRRAFQSLKKASLIEPIYLGSDSDIPSHMIRYAIAGQRVRGLITEVWKLYEDKHTLLYMKSSVEKLDEKEIQWLSYLFGDSIANKMLKNWKVRQASYENYRVKKDKNYRASRKDIEIERTKASYLRLSSDIKEQLHHLNEKYRPLMEEYSFLLHLVPGIVLLQ
jgi:hypothetical protein